MLRGELPHDEVLEVGFGRANADCVCFDNDEFPRFHEHLDIDWPDGPRPGGLSIGHRVDLSLIQLLEMVDPFTPISFSVGVTSVAAQSLRGEKAATRLTLPV